VIKARLSDLGGTLLPGSPAAFGKLIADETEKWGKVIRAAGIKADWLRADDGIPYLRSANPTARRRACEMPWNWFD
jgi:hypothetical protein